MAFTGPQPEGTPQTIYKYRYFDAEGHQLRALGKAELWFASARSFNDPFDSALEFDLSGLHDEIAFRWAENFLGRDFPEIDLAERQRLARLRIEEMRDDPEYVSWFNSSHIEENYNRFGICSLTPYKDSLLMWAHYSKDHSGFCFGVDTKKLFDLQLGLARSKIVLDLYKISYAEQMPRIDLFKSMMAKDGDHDLLHLVTIKSAHWAYESEYRLILWNHPNTLLPIGFDAITEIILGCRIKAENRQSVLALVQNSHLKARVFQAVKGKEKFELEFDPVS